MRVPDSVNKRFRNLFSFRRHIHVCLLLRSNTFGNILLRVTTCSYIYYVVADFGVMSISYMLCLFSVFVFMYVCRYLVVNTFL